MKFAFIQTEKAQWPVTAMCSALQVSTSGFYAWQRRVPSKHEKKDIRLKVLIRESFDKSRKTYGSPRVLVDLAGEKVGRNRIIREALRRPRDLPRAHCRPPRTRASHRGRVTSRQHS